MEIAGKAYITPNVGKADRAMSVIAGTLMALYGAKKRNALGAGLAFLGAGMIRRGVTGFCYTYQYLGVRTADTGQGSNVSIPYEMGVRVDRSTTINKPREEVFAFWRNLENLPRFMKHLKSVKVTGEKTSRWTALAPRGRTVEWDAEIINEIPGELLAWRSLPGADVDNAGSVHFADATGGRGTSVRVTLQYNPPGGVLGAYLAKLFGEEPEQQITDDLRRLKSMVESGQVIDNTGQVSGREAEQTARTDRKRHDDEHLREASEESFPASDAPAYR